MSSCWPVAPWCCRWPLPRSSSSRQSLCCRRRRWREAAGCAVGRLIWWPVGCPAGLVVTRGGSPPGGRSGGRPDRSTLRSLRAGLRRSGAGGWPSLGQQHRHRGHRSARPADRSGLGCPTWPKCSATSYVAHPSLGYHGAIEFGNRLLTFVLALIAVLTWVAARGIAKMARRAAIFGG